MNTKQLLITVISLCIVATQINAMEPETDAQRARRLRQLAAQAAMPATAEEQAVERMLTAQAIAELLEEDEAQERALAEEENEAAARMLDEKLRNKRAIKELMKSDNQDATDALLARIRAEEAAERARHDAILAAAIAEQLQAQDREDQERASVETARRLQAELNNNK